MLTSRKLRCAVLSLLLPAMILVQLLPGLAMAQTGSAQTGSMQSSTAQASAQDACTAAKAAGSANVPGAAWLLGGCLVEWWAVIFAYIMVPSPPASSLIGKSPEYVAIYTDCYKEGAKSAQVRMAWTGCLIGCVVVTAIEVAAIAAAAAATDTNNGYLY